VNFNSKKRKKIYVLIENKFFKGQASALLPDYAKAKVAIAKSKHLINRGTCETLF